MKNDNYDDMKELFEKDIELPESLSKENIVKKIKESGIKQQKKKNKILPRFVAAAAVFAVVATGAFAVYERSFGSTRQVSLKPAQEVEEVKQETAPQEQENAQKTAYAAIDVGTEKTFLSKFNSQKDLNNYFSNMASKEREVAFDDFIGNIKTFNNAKSAERTDGAPAQFAGDQSNAASITVQNDGSFGKTNTQVDGVDEADVIKNDGTYLYIANKEKISIVDAKTMKLASQTEIKASSGKYKIHVSEIYVNGDRLVATGYEYDENEDGEVYSCINGCFFQNIKNSIAIVYDISDRNNVFEVRRVTQDGEILSTRMIGSYLYTATSYFPNLSKNKKSEYTPEVDGTKLTVDDVYVQSKDEESTTYIVLSGFDTANKNSKVSKISVLANGYEVYCSNDTLYVAEERFEEKNNRQTTTVHAFSLNDGVVAYRNSGSVPGSLDDRYMMDQSGDYFRIATSEYNYKTDLDISSLFVLDKDMNVIGKLEDIAKDEQIKSVRFMGNTAYVVTFKNTDPLFAIDLSKPNKPKILGSVKLPGFSEYLHPISENLLVGIGYDGDEENADFSKVKISLFDVSNKKNPKEIDTHIIKNASCSVNYSPKSFLTIDENTFGIPVYYHTAKSGKLIFKTFTVKDGKFSEKSRYIHNVNSEGSDFFRGTFIGDYIYTIDETTVKQFNMNTEEELAALDYISETENEEETVLYNENYDDATRTN